MRTILSVLNRRQKRCYIRPIFKPVLGHVREILLAIIGGVGSKKYVDAGVEVGVVDPVFAIQIADAERIGRMATSEMNVPRGWK